MATILHSVLNEFWSTYLTMIRILDFLQLVLVLKALYSYVVVNFSNVFNLGVAPWYVVMHHSLIQTIVDTVFVIGKLL